MKFKNYLDYSLYKKPFLKKKLFSLIKDNLNFSIFSLLSFKDFKKIYLNINKKLIYINFVEDKISCLMTYLTKENEKLLKNYLLIFFLKNPIKFLIFLINPINFFKNISPPDNYLQLFHFVNLNLQIITKKKKYYFINKVHKFVIKNDYEGIYVIFKNNNYRAKKYYKNNNFKIYKKNLFYSLALKKFQSSKKIVKN